MFSLTFSYYINTVNAAGMVDCEGVETTADFETTDIDHAFELANRQWELETPANYIEGTLQITLA